MKVLITNIESLLEQLIFLSSFAEESSGMHLKTEGTSAEHSDEVLRENIRSAHRFRKGSRKPVKRWMILVLAAIVVVLVALLLMWFMSGN